jgi:UDP-N-acetylglucosamine--N-acetylmuramyl-(pentapeptide) pyrophosphoryl-undecaprenol N-acetylglucosamine transferase
MKNNILIITGGTGGHVIPAVHFFKYLENDNKQVYLLTDIRGSKYINGINKKNIYQIHSSHLSGDFFFKLKALIKLFTGLIQSFRVFFKIKPRVIISFGSYASLTPLLCFIILKFLFKTKLYLHEQNSVVGQTNKIFVKYSNKIFMHFNKNYINIQKYSDKILITGLPQKILKDNLNFNASKNNNTFKFLVFAGSQGSIDILLIFIKIIEKIKKVPNIKKIKFIIQCPQSKKQEIKDLLIKNNYDFQIQDFYENFENILRKTNIALCRSGAGTINDLINFRIPAIISPLTTAKDNHQYENAKILSNAECALILNNNKLNIDKIITFINKVVNDKNFNKSLLDNFSKINRPNANELMWKCVEDDQRK